MIGVEIGTVEEKDSFYGLGKSEMKRVINEFGELMKNASNDIVVGSRSLKQQAVEKCGYSNVDFDHYGFMFHQHSDYFNML